MIAAGLLAASLWQQRDRVSSAELLERPKSHDVRIVRDSWGVPHVFGAKDSDVAFRIGYAHAEDDYATIKDVTLAIRGSWPSRPGSSQPPAVAMAPVRPASCPCSAAQ